MKISAGTVIGIVTIVVMIFVGFFFNSTRNTEKLAGAQLTQTANPQIGTATPIPPEAWQPVSLDLAKAEEFGITPVEREWPETNGLLYLYMSSNNFSIHLYRWTIEDQTCSVNPDGDRICPTESYNYKPSDIKCGMTLSHPQEPQSQSQRVIVADVEDFLPIFGYLSHRVWDLYGSTGNILEFSRYTADTQRNNPICTWFVEHIID